MPPLPTQLHRYRSLEGDGAEYLERTIRLGEVYFPKPTQFNDPFDCRPVHSMQAPKQSLKDFYSGVYARQAKGMNRSDRRAEIRDIGRNPTRDPTLRKNLEGFRRMYHSSVTDKIGILCLSEVPDDILMWAHYANSHAGVCLVFNTDSPYLSNAQPVIYTKKRPKINPVFDTHEDMLDRALLTKSDHWAYEREWRAFSYKDGFGVRHIPLVSLNGVILGAQISSSNKKKIKQWISSRLTPMSLFEAELSEEEFSISMVPAR